MNGKIISGLIGYNRKYLALLSGLLVLISLYDLVAPPLATTIWRQAQTALITENFVKEGFSLSGLYVGLNGNEKLMMVYEFPVYNFIVGLLFKIININPFWGKLVSLTASIITMILLVNLVRIYAGHRSAFFTGLFFILIPIDVLMFTAFQPDALGVMCMLAAIFVVNSWRKHFRLSYIFVSSIFLLLSGLCKFPILVPYFPVFGLLYFFPRGKFRVPRIVELLVLAVVFLVPFVSWYLYRAHLIDPVLLGVEGRMFFLGDLGRFLTLSYYLKPAMMYTIMVCCGTGIIYFFRGMLNLRAIELCLLAGIPLYYIIIPTAADQAYYIYPLGPIIAIFMSRGFCALWDYFANKKLMIANFALASSFALFSLFGVAYLLRQDNIMYAMGNEVQKVTQSTDLIFAINMHDRGVWVGGYNPSVEYFTQRKGWNIQNFNAYNFQNTLDEIESKRILGAKWLIVTWYTPAMEPWYSSYLPKQFSRLPLFDSKAVADKLKLTYSVTRSAENFAILDLKSLLRHDAMK